MEITQLKALSRPMKVILDDGEGNALGEIIFRYLPGAITKETLPAFIALDDEPLARAQRHLMSQHLETEKAEAEKIKANKGKPKTDEPPGESLTMEEMNARIDKRRADSLQSDLQKMELAAKKLCLLLDPKDGHDLTSNGERLPIAWETFADHLPLALVEAVTLSILEAMKDPFGLVSSLAASLNGAYAGAGGDSSRCWRRLVVWLESAQTIDAAEVEIAYLDELNAEQGDETFPSPFAFYSDDKNDQRVAQFATGGDIERAKQLPLEDYSRYLLNKAAEIAAEPGLYEYQKAQSERRAEEDKMREDSM